MARSALVLGLILLRKNEALLGFATQNLGQLLLRRCLATRALLELRKAKLRAACVQAGGNSKRPKVFSLLEQKLPN